MTVHVPPPKPAPPLRQFAEAISSAGDLDVANWQEHALTNPRTRDGMIVWSITGVSLFCGLAVLAAGVWFLVRPTLAFLPKLLVVQPHDRTGLFIVVAGMVAVIAAGATAMTIFQLGSRVAFAGLGRPRV